MSIIQYIIGPINVEVDLLASRTVLYLHHLNIGLCHIIWRGRNKRCRYNAMQNRHDTSTDVVSTSYEPLHIADAAHRYLVVSRQTRVVRHARVWDVSRAENVNGMSNPLVLLCRAVI